MVLSMCPSETITELGRCADFTPRGLKTRHPSTATSSKHEMKEELATA